MSHESFFIEAGKEAEKSLCHRDKCGAVVVLNDEIIGRGFSGPANGDISQRKCDLNLVTSNKPKSDRTCCIHAEWRALIDALKNKKNIKGSTLYFTRVDENGNLLKSGEPYCTVCSRLMLDNGVENVALWHGTGIKVYDAREFNEAAYEFHIKQFTETKDPKSSLYVGK